jgi:hypothetical protein
MAYHGASCLLGRSGNYLQVDGYSPFYMAHSIEPLLPFDITLSTFLMPDLVKPFSTANLLTIRACQLEKREDDLDSIQANALKAHHASIRQFEQQFKSTIRNNIFRPGDLILVRNSAIETVVIRGMKCKEDLAAMLRFRLFPLPTSTSHLPSIST